MMREWFSMFVGPYGTNSWLHGPTYHNWHDSHETCTHHQMVLGKRFPSKHYRSSLFKPRLGIGSLTLWPYEDWWTRCRLYTRLRPDIGPDLALSPGLLSLSRLMDWAHTWWPYNFLSLESVNGPFQIVGVETFILGHYIRKIYKRSFLDSEAERKVLIIRHWDPQSSVSSELELPMFLGNPRECRMMV